MKIKILNNNTGRLCSATITKVRLKDFDKITDDRFNTFRWQELKTNYTGVFKIMKDSIILGLMDFSIESVFVNVKELTKIELSIENRGANKRFDYLAGCLIAYACLITKKSPKLDMGIFYTKATKHIYVDKYGMTPLDEYYVKSDKKNCEKLIAKYLNIPC